MKKEILYSGLLAIFIGSFLITGCLNEDNKIPPNCYDGILNNDEFLIDCGGPNCPACNHCIDGIWQPELGETWLDCGGECPACQPCSNGIQDGDETGIDCGGSCNVPCASLCDDGLLNGNEQAVDCGGACDPCPTCTDLTMNGTELGVDCGGGTCPPCSSDGNCLNGVLDGYELWIDCGNGAVGLCPGCDTIFTWKVGTTTYTCNPSNITFSFTGDATTGQLNAVGVALQGGTYTLKVAPPSAGWQDGAQGTFGPTTAPNTLMAHTSATNIQYSTGFGTASGQFTVQRYIVTTQYGKLLRVLFNGTLFTSDGSQSVIITNGLLMYPLP